MEFGWKSLTNDEADIYLSSYLIAKSGSDINNHSFSLVSGILTAKPTVPIYLGTLPWLFSSSKSLLLARLPFAFFNSITPVLFFIFIFLISSNIQLALLSFLIFNFSPWFSFLSTTGYESMMSLFFMLTSMIIVTIKMKSMKLKVTLTLFSLFLLFNSYMGFKLIFPFFCLILYLGYLSHNNLKIQLKKLFLTVFLIIVLTGVFQSLTFINQDTKLTKAESSTILQWRPDAQVAGLVWYERLTTGGPETIKKLVANKIVLRLKDYMTKYMSSYDLSMYFYKGDPSALYGTANLSGFFFLTDLVLFLLAVVNYQKISKNIRPYLILFFIGALPVAISYNAPSFALRSLILIIPFSICIAYGAHLLINKHAKRYGLVIFLLIIVVNTSLFFLIFKTRVLVLNSEMWHKSDGILAFKVMSLSKSKKINIYTPERREFFSQLAFYAINDTQVIKNAFRNEKYSYKNVNLLIGCPVEFKTNEIAIFRKDHCKSEVDLNKVQYTVIAPAGDMSGNDYYLVER